MPRYVEDNISAPPLLRMNRSTTIRQATGCQICHDSRQLRARRGIVSADGSKLRRGSSLRETMFPGKSQEISYVSHLQPPQQANQEEKRRERNLTGRDDQRNVFQKAQRRRNRSNQTQRRGEHTEKNEEQYFVARLFNTGQGAMTLQRSQTRLRLISFSSRNTHIDTHMGRDKHGRDKIGGKYSEKTHEDCISQAQTPIDTRNPSCLLSDTAMVMVMLVILLLFLFLLLFFFFFSFFFSLSHLQSFLFSFTVFSQVISFSQKVTEKEWHPCSDRSESPPV